MRIADNQMKPADVAKSSGSSQKAPSPPACPLPSDIA